MLALLTIAFCLAAPILGQQCPEPYGVQTYPHDTLCDKFHLVRAFRSSKLCNSIETEKWKSPEQMVEWFMALWTENENVQSLGVRSSSPGPTQKFLNCAH